MRFKLMTFIVASLLAAYAMGAAQLPTEHQRESSTPDPTAGDNGGVECGILSATGGITSNGSVVVGGQLAVGLVIDGKQIVSQGAVSCWEGGVNTCCETGGPTCVDCNGNDIPDECEIAAGTVDDLNHNGRPDECDDPSLVADLRIDRALEVLAAESLIPPQVVFTRSPRPIPTWVGVRVPVSVNLPQDPVIRSLDFVIRHRKLYDLANPLDQLYLRRILRHDNGVNLYYGQQVNHIPVFGAELGVHLSSDQSTVIATSGYYLPKIPVFAPAQINAPQAEAIALADLGVISAAPVGETRLMIYNEGLLSGLETPIYLAWRVILSEPSPDTVTTVGRLHYFIDAHDGAIITKFDPTPTGAPKKDYNIVGVTAAGARQKWFTENGPTSNYPTCAGGFPGCNALPGCDTDADNLFCFVDQTYDYYWSNFELRSWCSVTIPLLGFIESTINGTAHQPSIPGPTGITCPNAWELNFAISFCNGMAVRDIVAHEYTHAIIRCPSGSDLKYQFQSGALNESFADFFGAMVDGDWIHGAGTCAVQAGCPALNGCANRSLQNPELCGHPNNMNNFLNVPINSDQGGVHTNSGIPNKVGFLLTDGGTHRGFVINGLGRPRSQQLHFEVMNRLTQNAKFINSANLMVTIAKLLWGTTDPQAVCDVRNAWVSVGVLTDSDVDCDGVLDPIDPDNDGDGIADSNDNCPLVRNRGQNDLDGDGFGDRCDADADGDSIFDDGDGSGVAGDNPCTAGNNVACDDNCPLVPNIAQIDLDGNSIGELCQDDDGDGIANARDNCQSVRNSIQLDTDGDCLSFGADPRNCGDACDSDLDGDGFPNGSDNCPTVPNTGSRGVCSVGELRQACFSDTDCGEGGTCFKSQLDIDNDSIGDACDNCGGVFDGCQAISNTEQENADHDACGDACDGDIDGDGITNNDDNCPSKYNPRQVDLDGNGVGLGCDNEEIDILHSGPFIGILPIPDLIAPRILIPIDPCLADGPGCQHYLTPDYVTRVEVVLPTADITVRIIDDTGLTAGVDVVGVDALEHTLLFNPALDNFYEAPDFFLASTASATGSAEPFRGRKYFLEITAPKALGGQSVEIGLSVQSVADIACPQAPFELLDFNAFVPCLDGPGVSLFVPACLCNDLDQDGDRDLRDFARFQMEFAAP